MISDAPVRRSFPAASLRVCRVAGALMAGLAPSAFAELAWVESRVVVEPPAGAATAVGFFHFINRGSAPIRIADVRASCGCTAGTVERDVFAPGMEGSVQATFQAAGRQGSQSVALTVVTEEPHLRMYDLVLEVHLQDFATLTPLAHSWRVGEAITSQVFRVALANDFRFVGVESTSPAFITEIVKQSGQTVELKVTPHDLWAKRVGQIKVMIAQPGHAPLEITAQVRVI